jgi:hypothetical protein
MLRSAFALTVLIAAAAPAFAEKNRSIIGVWGLEAETCTIESGALRIEAKRMSGADVDCRFDTVSRKGATVTWTGICDDAEGSSRQTVTATERKGRLTIRYSPGGNIIENLRRCK